MTQEGSEFRRTILRSSDRTTVRLKETKWFWLEIKISTKTIYIFLTNLLLCCCCDKTTEEQEGGGEFGLPSWLFRLLLGGEAAASI